MSATDTPTTAHTLARRLNNPVNGDVTAGVQSLFKAIYSGGVARETLELVHLRASQVNGCSACVHAGVTSAVKAGESNERLHAVAAWYESPLFDDAERAALALTEAATRLADRPGAVTDELWEQATRHFDDRQLESIILMISITNFFNRINTTLKVPAGTTWS
jgi:AhpD family alkylhydroperoxidase